MPVCPRSGGSGIGRPWLLIFVAAWGAAYFLFMPHPMVAMRHNWAFSGVGFCGTVVGNVSAIGGGIVFIPVMIFAFGMPPVTVMKIAIASQAFGMTSGAMGWMQKRVVPPRALKVVVPGLLVGSTLSSLVIHPNAMLVKLLFGPVSIVLGVLTVVLARRRCATRADRRAIIPPRARAPIGADVAAGRPADRMDRDRRRRVGGRVAMLAYGVDVAACIGLGVVLLSINSIYLAVIHQFFLGGIPWDVAAFTAFGCVFGPGSPRT